MDKVRLINCPKLIGLSTFRNRKNMQDYDPIPAIHLLLAHWKYHNR